MSKQPGDGALARSVSPPDPARQEALDRLTGLACRALRVRLACILLPDAGASFHPEGWEADDPRRVACQALAQHAAATGEPLAVADLSAPPHRHADAVAGLAMPLLGPKRELLGAFGVIDDRPRAWREDELDLARSLAETIACELLLRRKLQAKVQAETRLRARGAETRRQLRELETLYHAAPVGLALLGRDLRVLRINEFLAAINGRTVDEHLGRPLREIVPDLVPSLEPVLRQVLATGEPVQGVEVSGATAFRPEVVRHWVEDFYPVRSAEGAVVAVGAVVRDVTERHHAEQALDLSEQRFKVALAGSPIVVFQQDAELRYRWVYNPPLGLSAEELLSRCDTELLPPEFAAPIEALKRQVLATGLPVRREVTAGREGRAAVYDLYVEPLRDRNGRIVGLTGAGTDITERKAAEAARERLLAELEGLYQRAPLGLALLDRDLRFVRINAALAEINGLPVEAHLGRSAWEIVPSLRAQAEPLLRRVLETGTPVVGVEISGETPKAPGVMRHWLEQFYPIEDPAGGVIGVGIICEEVTARKRAEAALTESEARFRNLAEHAPTMVWVTDADGRCTYINRRWYAYTGQPPGAALGLGWLEHIHPEDQAPTRAVFLGANTKREPFSLDYRLRRRDGAYRWAIDAAAPRFAEDGTFLGYVGSVIDIDERRTMEQALKDSEGRLRRVLDNLFAFVGVLDLDGRLIEANRAPLDAAGLARAAVIGKPFWQCAWWSWSPEVQARLKAAVALAAAGETVRYDVPVRMAGDRLVTIDFQIAPLRDQTGRITHLIPSGVDVDERVRVEAALRESEQNLKLALAAGHMGVWRYDPAAGTTAIDAAERALLGFAPDTAVVTVEEVFARIHEEDREAVRTAVARSIETGAEFQAEFRILRPEGEVRWLSGRGGVVRDGTGRPAAMTGVNWDVTERRQAEAERARLAAIVEQASDLIGSADVLGRILYLNRAGRHLLGIGEEEDLGGLKADAFHPDWALGRIKSEALPTARHHGTWSGESALLTRDGQEIPISQLIIGHHNGTSQPAYFSTIARDISGQKRAERQRELLLRELSHRVKNILALVQAIARQTGARTRSVSAFVEAFGGRVMALAAAHELLTATGWAGAGLAELVKKALTPYLGRGAPRVRLQIQDLSLKPEAAQNLALALHELATNAAKYGALSRPEGSVAVEARLSTVDGEGRMLDLVWREAGGPTVQPPSRQGFGTTLLGRVVGAQHRGRVTLDWRTEGLVCRLLLPEDEVRSTGADRPPP